MRFIDNFFLLFFIHGCAEKKFNPERRVLKKKHIRNCFLPACARTDSKAQARFMLNTFGVTGGNRISQADLEPVEELLEVGLELSAYLFNYNHGSSKQIVGRNTVL